MSTKSKITIATSVFTFFVCVCYATSNLMTNIELQMELPATRRSVAIQSGVCLNVLATHSNGKTLFKILTNCELRSISEVPLYSYCTGRKTALHSIAYKRCSRLTKLMQGKPETVKERCYSSHDASRKLWIRFVEIVTQSKKCMHA